MTFCNTSYFISVSIGRSNNYGRQQLTLLTDIGIICSLREARLSFENLPFQCVSRGMGLARAFADSFV